MSEIFCLVRKKMVDKTPEETVRQEYIKRLVEEYGYPLEHIDVEVWIDDGSGKVVDVDTGQPKRADIVVYRSHTRQYDEIEIIVECKKKDIESGERQVKSYGNRTTAEILVWYNGNLPTRYWQRKRKPNTWTPKAWLPRYGETYEDKKIYKTDLRPAKNLVSVFNRIHNDIYANAKSGNKSKVFYQVIYLLFAKIEDELRFEKECNFVIYDREYELIEKGLDSQSFRERIIDDLFASVKKRPQFQDVFDENDRIEIPVLQIANIVSELEYISILDTDVKGEAFQTFLSSHFRGDAGQFFTPDPVKKMVVDMLEPPPNKVVLDPACGSAGFLIFCLNKWKEALKEREGYIDDNGKPKSDHELSESERKHIRAELKLLAKDYIRGIDFDNDLTKVAKMYMVMVDDGHTGIYTINSLLPFDDIGKATNHEISRECADFILTNPPFGSKGKVKQVNILKEYDFGYSWKKVNGKYIKDKFIGGNKRSGQTPDILFIERCYQLLRFNGVLAIVLPDGDLTNQNTEFVRQWILEKFQVLAVISLPAHTFDPYGTGVKSCILIARKAKKVPDNYSIFFASINNIGYDIRGRTVYKRINGMVVTEEEKPVGFSLARNGLKPPKRDYRNYPLDIDGNPIEVYEDKLFKRIYKAWDGIPLDKQGNKVPYKVIADGMLEFNRDDKGRILDSKGKPAPYDEFRQYQDQRLIDLHGAVADDIPDVVRAWSVFKDLLEEGKTHEEIRSALMKVGGKAELDEKGLLKKRLFYVKSIKEIDGIKRLHPDYWQERYDEITRRLSQNTVKLGDIATIKGGATPLGSNYLKGSEGVPFFRVQNVGDFGLILDDLVYIPRSIHEGELKRSQIRPKDILFTITGRLGSVAVVPDSIPEGNINQHIVRIRIKDDYAADFIPEFVAIYLNSPVIKELIEREQYGTTRTALDYPTIENFRIPKIPVDVQNEMVQDLREALRMIAKAYDVRKQAIARSEGLLLKAIHK